MMLFFKFPHHNTHTHSPPACLQHVPPLSNLLDLLTLVIFGKEYKYVVFFTIPLLPCPGVQIYFSAPHFRTPSSFELSHPRCDNSITKSYNTQLDIQSKHNYISNKWYINYQLHVSATDLPSSGCIQLINFFMFC